MLMCLQRMSHQIFHHRDILKRPYSGPRDTRFLNPKDGRPTKLVVQCSDEVLANRSGADWSRTTTVNKGPWMFRLAHWATADGQSSVFWWLPACAVLTIVVSRSCRTRMSVMVNVYASAAKPVPRHDKIAKQRLLRVGPLQGLAISLRRKEST